MSSDLLKILLTNDSFTNHINLMYVETGFGVK